MFLVDCFECKLVYIWCSSEHLLQIYGRRRAEISLDWASASNNFSLGSDKQNEEMELWRDKLLRRSLGRKHGSTKHLTFSQGSSACFLFSTYQNIWFWNVIFFLSVFCNGLWLQWKKRWEWDFTSNETCLCVILRLRLQGMKKWS